MKKICVIGAYGFIGRSICEALANSNKNVKGFVRNLDYSNNCKKINYVPVGDIGPKSKLKDALIETDCIIHCAGKTHVINELKKKRSETYLLENFHCTKRIAEEAVEAGVKRLIFLSSIKVNGENTPDISGTNYQNNQIKNFFSYTDTPDPQDFYAISKLKAEKALCEISLRSGLEVVILRLPLVYGYGVKGNLLRLTKLIRSGMPIPLKNVKNLRSMIGIDNLVDLLINCINHPNASGKTFLVSDNEDLSTPELIKLISSSMGRKANLFPLPVYALKFLASIFGKSEEMNRLIGSLRIDNSYTKEILNWSPPVSVEEGIKRMVQGK